VRVTGLARASLSTVVGGRMAVEQLTDPNVQVIDHLHTHSHLYSPILAKHEIF